MSHEHFRIDNSTIGAVVNNGTVNQSVPSKNSESAGESFDMQTVLVDLQKLRDELANTKDAIDDLRSAIETGNEDTKVKKIKSLSSGVASTIVKTLASESVKRFLHLTF